MTENEQNAKIFKAFCDANRLKILGLLQNGEKCACQLLEQLDIGQPGLTVRNWRFLNRRNVWPS